METIIAIVIFLSFIIFIIHCPIFKSWFGFRKPAGHKGKWFE